MSLRHHLAVSALDTQEQDIKVLLSLLQAAVSECRLFGVTERKDSAVLLLAGQLAFVTGTDSSVQVKYQDHYTVCMTEVQDDLATIQSSKNLN